MNLLTFEPSEEVQFLLNTNNEGMIWTVDGTLLQGLMGEGIACNGMFGDELNGFVNLPDPHKHYKHFTLEQ
ncbi:5902_t:CDS:2, partial [Diversispora eburnea]